MTTATVDEVDEADLPLAWTQIPPGPELTIQLALTEWAALPDRELADAVEAARRVATWAQSLMLEGVAELSRRRTGHRPYDSDTHRRICGEVSLELTVPTGHAEELVCLAETLPELPNTWAALRTGQIDYDRARLLADGLAGLDPALARRLDATLIGDAVEATKTQLRRKLTRAIKQADPGAHAARTESARTERRVELWDNDDDTCDLVGRNLAAADAHAIRNRLTAAAQALKTDGDVRTVDQIRADLHTDLLRGIPLPEAVQNLITAPPITGPMTDPSAKPTGPTTGSATTQASGSTPRMTTRPSASTAAPATEITRSTGPAIGSTTGPTSGVTAEPSTAPTKPSPTTSTMPRAQADRMRLIHGSHTGDGLAAEISAVAERVIAEALAEVADEQLTAVFDRARADGSVDRLARLIGDAAEAMRGALTGTVDTWCRATGQHAGHGHPGYRPPAAMQRLIQRRHPTCVYPTCNRRSVHCDLDHTQPYDKGGRTCRCNMSPLCRAHHRIIKQHPDWKLIQLWPGLLLWVTPAGKWHIVTPQ